MRLLLGLWHFETKEEAGKQLAVKKSSGEVPNIATVHEAPYSTLTSSVSSIATVTRLPYQNTALRCRTNSSNSTGKDLRIYRSWLQEYRSLFLSRMCLACPVRYDEVPHYCGICVCAKAEAALQPFMHAARKVPMMWHNDASGLMLLR